MTDIEIYNEILLEKDFILVNDINTSEVEYRLYADDMDTIGSIIFKQTNGSIDNIEFITYNYLYFSFIIDSLEQLFLDKKVELRDIIIDDIIE